MNKELDTLNKLCKIYDLEKKTGFTDTYIDEIKLFKISNNEQLIPLFYKKGFSFIGQEKKVGYVSTNSEEYGEANYLINCAPQVSECETFIIGKEPLLGIYITLNTNRLNRIVKKFIDIKDSYKLKKTHSYTVMCNIRTSIIQDVYFKLLSILHNKVEANMLSDGLLDELYFRILQSPNGFMLEQLCQKNSTLSKISNVTEYILNNLEKKISLDDMAKLSDMSINNFHKLFKEAQQDTPIQFMKKMRLNKAKELIKYDNQKAIEASLNVGYTSFSQFSREFKREFGKSPSKIS